MTDSNNTTPTVNNMRNNDSDSGTTTSTTSTSTSSIVENKLLSEQPVVGRVSNAVAALWLFVWTLNNIGVTLINKAAFAVVDFNYPYALSAIHMLVCSIGTSFLFWCMDRTTTLNNNFNLLKSSTSDTVDDNDNENMDLEQQMQQHSLRQRTTTSNSLQQQQLDPTNHPQQEQFLIQQHHHEQQSYVVSNTIDSIARFVSNTILGSTGSTPGVHRQQLDRSGHRMLYLFSIIFTLNIAMGNVSLQYVSINFNQIVRSLVPAFTMWIGMLFFNHNISIQRQHAVLPIVFGVAMAGYGDRINYTYVGLFYTVLCTLLASLKVVASGEMLTSIKLHPLDLLHRMTPLAFVQCIILSVISGEMNLMIEQQQHHFSIQGITSSVLTTLFVVILSGVLAFALNISSFQAYKVTSPLTCCIVAAVKQVLTIFAGTMMFHTNITTLNGIGIFIVLMASARYSYIAVIENNNTKNSTRSTGKTVSGATALTNTHNGRNNNDSNNKGITNSTDPNDTNDASVVIVQADLKNVDDEDHDYNDDDDDDDDHDDEHTRFITKKCVSSASLSTTSSTTSTSSSRFR